MSLGILMETSREPAIIDMSTSMLMIELVVDVLLERISLKKLIEVTQKKFNCTFDAAVKRCEEFAGVFTLSKVFADNEQALTIAKTRFEASFMNERTSIS